MMAYVKGNKYPKATAFLSSTPYMKNKIIFAKYTIYIIIWLVCCTASFIEMHFISEIDIDDFAQASAIVFLIQSIYMWNPNLVPYETIVRVTSDQWGAGRRGQGFTALPQTNTACRP